MHSRVASLLGLGCLLVVVVAVMAVPTSAVSCSFDGMDFSSLAGTDIQGSDGTTRYQYYLSLCGPLSSSAAEQCVLASSEASACQLQVEEQPQSFDIGNWDTSAVPTWSHTPDGKGVTFTMNGAEQCWASGDKAAYTTSVVLQCAAEQGSMSVAAPASGSGSCAFTVTLPTPLACKGSSGGGGGGGSGAGGKHRLSGGWIFIIVLCVVLPLYVLVGCVYKSQKLGATGMDKCPNVEFWRDLPSLVKEGLSFTFGKLRGLCGGGSKSGSSSTYESM